MTWRELNDQLREATGVKVILQLYKAERKGKCRKRWLTRIYCRYSYLRRKKEMKAVASAESFVVLLAAVAWRVSWQRFNENAAHYMQRFSPSLSP